MSGSRLSRKNSAHSPQLTTSGRASLERSSARIAILQALAAPLVGDGDDVFDADDEMHEAESRDEPAEERGEGQGRQRGTPMPPKAEHPDARPWHHQEEQPCLEAVEGEKEGKRHQRGGF